MREKASGLFFFNRDRPGTTTEKTRKRVTIIVRRSRALVALVSRPICAPWRT